MVEDFGTFINNTELTPNELIKLLIESNDSCQTPIELAAEKNYDIFLKILEVCETRTSLSNNTSIQATLGKALLYMVKTNNFEATKRLLALGASKEQRFHANNGDSKFGDLNRANITHPAILHFSENNENNILDLLLNDPSVTADLFTQYAEISSSAIKLAATKNFPALKRFVDACKNKDWIIDNNNFKQTLRMFFLTQILTFKENNVLNELLQAGAVSAWFFGRDKTKLLAENDSHILFEAIKIYNPKSEHKQCLDLLLDHDSVTEHFFRSCIYDYTNSNSYLGSGYYEPALLNIIAKMAKKSWYKHESELGLHIENIFLRGVKTNNINLISAILKSKAISAPTYLALSQAITNYKYSKITQTPLDILLSYYTMEPTRPDESLRSLAMEAAEKNILAFWKIVKFYESKSADKKEKLTDLSNILLWYVTKDNYQVVKLLSGKPCPEIFNNDEAVAEENRVNIPELFVAFNSWDYAATAIATYNNVQKQNVVDLLFSGELPLEVYFDSQNGSLFQLANKTSKRLYEKPGESLYEKTEDSFFNSLNRERNLLKRFIALMYKLNDNQIIKNSQSPGNWFSIYKQVTNYEVKDIKNTLHTTLDKMIHSIDEYKQEDITNFRNVIDKFHLTVVNDILSLMNAWKPSLLNDENKESSTPKFTAHTLIRGFITQLRERQLDVNFKLENRDPGDRKFSIFANRDEAINNEFLGKDPIKTTVYGGEKVKLIEYDDLSSLDNDGLGLPRY